jgi:hypothetical protein
MIGTISNSLRGLTIHNPPKIVTGQPIGVQKKDVISIIETLRALGVHATLCGGAPRDWHLGYEVQDLDLYASVDTTKFSYNTLENRIVNNLNYHNKLEQVGGDERYDGLSTVTQQYHNITLVVLSFVSPEGQKSQLMLGTRPFNTLTQIVPFFSCSICEYYWDHEKDKILSSELNLKQQERQSVLVDYKCRNDFHIEKLKKKFNKYTFNAFPYHSKDRKCNFVEVEVKEFK